MERKTEERRAMDPRRTVGERKERVDNNNNSRVQEKVRQEDTPQHSTSKGRKGRREVEDAPSVEIRTIGRTSALTGPQGTLHSFLSNNTSNRSLPSNSNK